MRPYFLSLALLTLAPQGPAERIELEDPSQPPKDPYQEEVGDPLPWPFEGEFGAQRLWHNYSRPDPAGVRGGLLFVQRAGTEVRAVAGGVVLGQVYEDRGLVISTDTAGNLCWWYAGLDPASIGLKEGDTVAAGDVLGALEDPDDALSGLSLHHGRFTRDGGSAPEFESLTDPLRFFDAPDERKPDIASRMFFVRDDTLEEFEADDDGFPTVSGQVDILAAIRDETGAGGSWGTPVVTLEILGADERRVLSTLVLDQRGPLKPGAPVDALYLFDSQQLDEAARLQRLGYHVLRITNTDGDGVVEPEDAAYAWDTTKLENGRYRVIVRAWDLAGNHAERKVGVFVKN